MTIFRIILSILSLLLGIPSLVGVIYLMSNDTFKAGFIAGVGFESCIVIVFGGFFISALLWPKEL